MATKDPIKLEGDGVPVFITAADSFLATNTSPHDVQFCFSDGVPSSTVAWHDLEKKHGLVRNGLTNDLYMKSGHSAEISLSE